MKRNKMSHGNVTLPSRKCSMCKGKELALLDITKRNEICNIGNNMKKAFNWPEKWPVPFQLGLKCFQRYEKDRDIIEQHNKINDTFLSIKKRWHSSFNGDFEMNEAELNARLSEFSSTTRFSEIVEDRNQAYPYSSIVSNRKNSPLTKQPPRQDITPTIRPTLSTARVVLPRSDVTQIQVFKTYKPSLVGKVSHVQNKNVTRILESSILPKIGPTTSGSAKEIASPKVQVSEASPTVTAVYSKNVTKISEPSILPKIGPTTSGSAKEKASPKVQISEASSIVTAVYSKNVTKISEPSILPKIGPTTTGSAKEKASPKVQVSEASPIVTAVYSKNIQQSEFSNLLLDPENFLMRSMKPKDINHALSTQTSSPEKVEQKKLIANRRATTKISIVTKTVQPIAKDSTNISAVKQVEQKIVSQGANGYKSTKDSLKPSAVTKCFPPRLKDSPGPPALTRMDKDVCPLPVRKRKWDMNMTQPITKSELQHKHSTEPSVPVPVNQIKMDLFSDKRLIKGLGVTRSGRVYGVGSVSPNPPNLEPVRKETIRGVKSDKAKHEALPAQPKKPRLTIKPDLVKSPSIHEQGIASPVMTASGRKIKKRVESNFLSGEAMDRSIDDETNEKAKTQKRNSKNSGSKKGTPERQVKLSGRGSSNSRRGKKSSELESKSSVQDRKTLGMDKRSTGLEMKTTVQVKMTQMKNTSKLDKIIPIPEKKTKESNIKSPLPKKIAPVPRKKISVQEKIVQMPGKKDPNKTTTWSHGKPNDDTVIVVAPRFNQTLPMPLRSSLPLRVQKMTVTFKCSLCDEDFPDNESLMLHETENHLDMNGYVSTDESDTENLELDRDISDGTTATDIEERYPMELRDEDEELMNEDDFVEEDELDFSYVCSPPVRTEIQNIDLIPTKERGIPKTGKRSIGINDCKYCEASFENQESLLQHRKSVHEGINCFPCTLCEDDFRTQRILQNHMTQHVEMGDIACDDCGKLFKTSELLEIHKKTHNVNTISPFPCPECYMGFDLSEKLNSHMRGFHSADKGKAIRCDRCTELFPNMKDIRDHQKKQPLAAQILCPLCDEKFIWQCATEIHKKGHSNNFKEQCRICNYVCTSEREWKIHQSSAHP